MGAKSGEVKETYTVQEVAKLMKCSDQKIRNLIRSKDLRGTKVGRSWRISHAEVLRLTSLEV